MTMVLVHLNTSYSGSVYWGTDGDALTTQKYYRIEFVRVLNKLIMDTISVSSDLFVKGYKFLGQGHYQ